MKMLLNLVFIWLILKGLVSKVIRKEYLLKKVDKEGREGELQNYEFVVNNYGIAYKNKDEDGLIEMIRYEQLITDLEYQDIQRSQQEIHCCLSIKPIRFYDEVDRHQQKYVPFQCLQLITNQNITWRICDSLQNHPIYNDDHGDGDGGLNGLDGLAQELKKKIVKMASDRLGIQQTDRQIIILSSMKEEQQKKRWQYGQEQNWNDRCINDENQSPILIRDEYVVQSSKELQLRFKYKGDKDGLLVRGRNDIRLIGMWGLLEFDNGLQQKTNIYCGWKIEIKYPQEHRIEGMTSDAELLVYHILMLNDDRCDDYDLKQLYKHNSTKIESIENDNSQLIVSFMISSDPVTKQEQSGQFWHELQDIGMTSNLKHINDDDSVQQLNSGGVDGLSELKDDQYLDLMKMVANGLKMGYNKSFYYYKGSLSIPNCKSVERIVMIENIKVDIGMFQKIKTKLRFGYDHQKNRRSIQNQDLSVEQMADYQIYYHIDTTEPCKMEEIDYIDDDYKDSQKRHAELQKRIDMLTDRKKSLVDNQDHQTKLQFHKVDSDRQLVQTQVTADIGQIGTVDTKLAQKVFKTKKSELMNGYSSTVVSDGHTQLKMVYMGNSDEYKPFRQATLDSNHKNMVDIHRQLYPKYNRLPPKLDLIKQNQQDSNEYNQETKDNYQKTVELEDYDPDQIGLK